MCGICGIISKEPIQETTPLYRMQKALHHRGPDGKGEFFHTHLALAMCRLSIIDLSGGWQPLYNEDRTLVLIANAEIYNFVELRNQLRSQGHIFSTGSDCETIVHLYEEHGSEFVHHLRGMFAIALWDSSKKQLILARDRMGEKPLYIYENEKQILFASELKALLCSKLIPFDLDPHAVNLYFHYQYVPEPRTPIKGIRKLDAANLMIVSLNPWHRQEICYWNLSDAPALIGNPTEIIFAELDKVSELVIRSDVPVGVALSGGLDSSAIAALAAQKYSGTLHAFCVGYPGYPPDDERIEAKTFANYLGIPFHDVELHVEDMVRFFPELIYHRDDPIADISGYGYYAVMKLAQENSVPVMLKGQGGDELFWGYPWVKQGLLESLNKRKANDKSWPPLSQYLRFYKPRNLGKRALLAWAFLDAFGLFSGFKKFHYYRNTPVDQMIFYELTPDFFTAIFALNALYHTEFKEKLSDPRPDHDYRTSVRNDELDILFTQWICNTYLRENGIVQGDRLSMASSVELRLPFVDYKLVETVVGLRKVQKDYSLPAKAWLKDALKEIVPVWVSNRPKKGFTPPVHVWHRALFSAYGEELQNGYLQQSGVFKKKACQKLAKGIFPNGAVSPLSFKALVLEIWCSQMRAAVSRS